MKIAIDGPAAAGKTTLAKGLAEKLDFWYIDTGSIYRAYALYLLRKGITSDEKRRIADLARIPDYFQNQIDVRFSARGKMGIFIKGKKINDGELRTQEVGMMASDIGTISEVRHMLLRVERGLAYAGDKVMEGRDITTTVLPDAELKIYLTANIDVRVLRRVKDLQARTDEPVLYEMVKEQLVTRDRQDMEREESPLRKADDAVLIDSTKMTADEVLQYVIKLVKERRS